MIRWNNNFLYLCFSKLHLSTASSETNPIIHLKSAQSGILKFRVFNKLTIHVMLLAHHGITLAVHRCEQGGFDITSCKNFFKQNNWKWQSCLVSCFNAPWFIKVAARAERCIFLRGWMNVNQLNLHALHQTAFEFGSLGKSSSLLDDGYVVLNENT